MIYKTIKISEERYKWLLSLMAELQKERGKKISFDDALNDIIRDRRGNDNVMKLAGSWKMKDKEAEELIGEIYLERRIKSRRI